MLYTIISLLVALFFLVLGLMGMILPWSAHARTVFIEFILTNTLAIFIFGFVFFLIGLAALFYLCENNKRKYIPIKKGALKSDVSDLLIKDYLSSYFHTLFPSQEIPCSVELKKKSAEIMIDLPFVPLEQQKTLLEKIEVELTDLFRDVIGYRKELKILISFGPESL